MDPEENRQGESITIEVPVDCGRERLDKFLGGHPGLAVSRSRVQKLIADGLVLVDSRTVPGKHLLLGGEIIQATIPPEPPTDIVGEEIFLDIVYEDAHLAVVNKPPGMVTHPAAGNHRGTLVNALVHHFKELAERGGRDRPGIVHRLDRNTSGLLVVARDDRAHLALQQAIHDRILRRTYLALVCGHLAEEQGRIDLPIGRSTRNRTKMSVAGIGGREAVTEYRVIERFRSYDLIEVVLLTGRTHQIRVHFSHLGHPVFGDPEYGGRERWHRGIFGPERPLAKRLLAMLNRQALHAARLDFAYPLEGEPMSGRSMSFEAPLPEDYRELLEVLRKEGS